MDSGYSLALMEQPKRLIETQSNNSVIDNSITRCAESGERASLPLCLSLDHVAESWQHLSQEEEATTSDQLMIMHHKI